MDSLNQPLALFDLSLPQLQTYLVANGYSKFVASQIFSWIYRKRILVPSDWSNLSKTLRAHLAAVASFESPRIVWNALSQDGTRKFLLEMSDGERVEAVTIGSSDRLTLCLSTQVGCAMKCDFCHTGTQGFTRHLLAGEIVAQYVLIQKWLHEECSDLPEVEREITNIVYMGQGEPLHNFENVARATSIFLEPQGIGFGQRRITLSTSGLVPQLRRFEEIGPINLAISLHATTDELRDQLMPVNRKYNLAELFATLNQIPIKPYRRITYEYMLLDGLNDQPADIERLAQLLDRTRSKLNIIPFNEYPGSRYRRPSPARVHWFAKELIDRGYTCVVRQTKGDDILAACGQLKSSVQNLNLWEI